MGLDGDAAELRAAMVQAVMDRGAYTRDEAEVLMQRIADRLGGYTHDEVVAMHPLPKDNE